MNLRGTYQLKAGDFLLTQEHQRISTILGSCVALTLFCKRLPLAGICHSLLPFRPSNHNPSPATQGEARYLNLVLPQLLNAFIDAGASREEIEVKLFGGASITNPAPGSSKRHQIGTENINACLHFLLKNKLTLRASNTGGRAGHQIVFDTTSGVVMHRLLKTELDLFPYDQDLSPCIR